MNVYEMEGFMRGKCMPRDILVNESTAAYLVRKLNEATALKAERDRLQYINEQTLQVKLQMAETIKKQFDRVNALAVENAALKNFCKNAAFNADYESELCMERGGFTDAFNNIHTPATDAALAAIEARGVEKFAESQKEYVRLHRAELDPMTRAAYCGSAADAERYANKLREAK